MSQTPGNLRVIRTARTEAEINHGVADGFWPLVQAANIQPPFDVWFQVFQHPETGKVSWTQSQLITAEFVGMVPVLPWQSYRPVRFQYPFAAYLLPRDLQMGEKVWLEDVIADIPDLSRKPVQHLTASVAVWNGQSFEIEVPHSVFDAGSLGGVLEDLMEDDFLD